MADNKNVENLEHRLKSLKMRYSGSKTTETSFDSKNLERCDYNFRADADQDDKALGKLSSVSKTDDHSKMPKIENFGLQTVEPEPTKPTHDRTTLRGTQQLTEKIKELQAELEQKTKEHSESQRQISLLKNQLADGEKTITEQKERLVLLSNQLVAKDSHSKEIKKKFQAAQQSVLEKDEKLRRLSEMFRKEDSSIGEVKEALNQSEEQLMKISAQLEEEQGRNVSCEEQILALKRGLVDETKMVKELEHFLGLQTDENKKLQETLRVMMEGVNGEKENLQRDFQGFWDESLAFLDKCKVHTNALVKAAGNNVNQ